MTGAKFEAGEETEGREANKSCENFGGQNQGSCRGERKDGRESCDNFWKMTSREGQRNGG